MTFFRSKLLRPLAVAAALSLGACAHADRNTYRASEVGKSSAVSFGSIVAVREIAIVGEQSGVGAGVGGVGGAIVGSQIGQGSGSVAAALAGVLVGAIAGAAIEQAAANRTGLEYTIALESGVILTVAQEAPPNERPLQVGERVIVQNSGGYQRVLPASQLPTEVKRPQGLKVVD